MPAPRSLTGHVWTVASTEIPESPDELLTMLIEMRGLSQKKEQLSSPMLFPEMKSAVDRILLALKKKEKVMIFGDYDADGITASALLLRFFQRHGGNADVMLPHRVKNGYGLKKSFIDECKKRGATLLLTVDTGVTAIDEIAYAKTFHIDTIVTDHHHARYGRPDAFAVIHPHLAEAFPNKDLCGAAVAFTLVRGLEMALGSDHHWKGMEEDFVLAMIGTIADAMPLRGENRTLVHFGLKYTGQLPDGPLRTFLRLGSGKETLTASDIGFRIAPLINASGRMDDPIIALHALIDGDEKMIAEIIALNAERKEKTAMLLEDARKKIDASHQFLVIQSENYPPGLVGLIAGRLTEEYGKPSLVGSISDGKVTASLRSIPEVHLSTLLSDPSISQYLESFGGHSQAAGCTFTIEKSDTLRIELCRAVKNLHLSEDILCPRIAIDTETSEHFLTTTFADMLLSLEPFGQGNREPLFLLRNQEIQNMRIVGQEKSHLQCLVGKVKAIAFNLAGLQKELSASKRFDIVARIGKDLWNDREGVQLFIEDVALSSVQTGTKLPSTLKTSVTSV